MFTTRPRLIRMTLLTLLAILALPLVATAQGTPGVPEGTENRRSIIVEGVGTVDITPDTADVSFGVITQNESLEEAQDENSTRTQALMDVFTEAGIAEEDIQTAHYSVRVINEYDRDGNLVGVQGFEVWNSVTVTIRDISIVGAILDEAIGAGANEVSSISFYVDNTDAAASQARRAAIEDARAKADEMAEAGGVIVTGVISIEELSSPEPSPIMFDTSEADAGGAAESAPRQVPVSPGQTSISVTVRVVFEIEQPQG